MAAGQVGGLCAIFKDRKEVGHRGPWQSWSPPQNKAQAAINQCAMRKGHRLCTLELHFIFVYHLLPEIELHNCLNFSDQMF